MVNVYFDFYTGGVRSPLLAAARSARRGDRHRVRRDAATGPAWCGPWSTHRTAPAAARPSPTCAADSTATRTRKMRQHPCRVGNGAALHPPPARTTDFAVLKELFQRCPSLMRSTPISRTRCSAFCQAECGTVAQRDALTRERNRRQQPGTVRASWPRSAGSGSRCPVEYGGGGGSFTDECVFLEETTRGLAPITAIFDVADRGADLSALGHRRAEAHGGRQYRGRQAGSHCPLRTGCRFRSRRCRHPACGRATVTITS